MTRGQRGREWAKLEFTAAIVAIARTGFVFVAAPGFIGGPMVANGTIGAAIAGFAVAGVAVGLLWMIRIYRTEPSPTSGPGGTATAKLTASTPRACGCPRRSSRG